jgi:hypothetical protein
MLPWLVFLRLLHFEAILSLLLEVLEALCLQMLLHAVNDSYLLLEVQERLALLRLEYSLVFPLHQLCCLAARRDVGIVDKDFVEFLRRLLRKIFVEGVILENVGAKDFKSLRHDVFADRATQVSLLPLVQIDLRIDRSVCP